MAEKDPFTVSELIQKIRNSDYKELSRQDLIRGIKALKDILLFATDFTQSELDEKELCVICCVAFHPDYCYQRVKDGPKVCDVCNNTY